MPPKPIADILAQLIARRGYAREQSAAAFAEAWTRSRRRAAGASSRARGSIKRGVLEVIVANSHAGARAGVSQNRRCSPSSTNSCPIKTSATSASASERLYDSVRSP